MIFLPKLDIIQALLQNLNEILQNKKVSTIIYSVCFMVSGLCSLDITL